MTHIYNRHQNNQKSTINIYCRFYNFTSKNLLPTFLALPPNLNLFERSWLGIFSSHRLTIPKQPLALMGANSACTFIDISSAIVQSLKWLRPLEVSLKSPNWFWVLDSQFANNCKLLYTLRTVARKNTHIIITWEWCIVRKRLIKGLH